MGGIFSSFPGNSFYEGKPMGTSLTIEMGQERRLGCDKTLIWAILKAVFHSGSA